MSDEKHEHHAPPVLFDELPAAGGRKIGQVTLNIPSTLNSLNLEMVDLMLEKLGEWRDDDSIACVFIRGSGEKAFCAGGDVQALRASAVENPGGPCPYAEDFYHHEYRLDYLIHTYPKPVVSWGHGIVMGGGLGVFAGSSHRVVTEKSRFAMPEVTIALFPDVGGSYFLNRMPDGAGRFLGLTAANFNGTDCLFLGLAEHLVENDLRDHVLEDLQSIEWHGDAAQQVTEVLAGYDKRSGHARPEGNVEKHMDSIHELCGDKPIEQVVEAITGLETDDPWLAKARDGLANGSPLSVLITDRQLREAAGKPLREVFKSELVLAVNIVRYPEFAEGVRALLIDKDRNPQWQYKTIQDVPADVLDSFFRPPWDTNPLADI